MYIIRMLVSVVLMLFIMNNAAISEPTLSKDRTLRMAGQTQIYIKDDGRLFAFSPIRDPADLSEYKKNCGLQFAFPGATIVENNNVDLAGVLNENKSEFKDGVAIAKFNGDLPTIFIGLTKLGNIECIATNEITTRVYNGTETRLDYGTVCNDISGITGVKELVKLNNYFGAWKYTGEFILFRPANPATGEPYDLFKNFKDPELKATLEYPLEHIGDFGMIKPLYPDDVPDSTYTYSAEYKHTSDFNKVKVSVRKEQHVDGNIKQTFNVPVVLFATTDEWVYETLDSDNLKYYRNKPFSDFQPVVSNTGKNVTVEGWAIKWDTNIDPPYHPAWKWTKAYERAGTDPEYCKASRERYSELVSVEKTVE